MSYQTGRRIELIKRTFLFCTGRFSPACAHRPPAHLQLQTLAEPGLSRVARNYSTSAQVPKICEDEPSQGLWQQNQNRVIASIYAQMHSVLCRYCVRPPVLLLCVMTHAQHRRYCFVFLPTEVIKHIDATCISLIRHHSWHKAWYLGWTGTPEEEWATFTLFHVLL